MDPVGAAIASGRARLAGRARLTVDPTLASIGRAAACKVGWRVDSRLTVTAFARPTGLTCGATLATALIHFEPWWEISGGLVKNGD